MLIVHESGSRPSSSWFASIAGPESCQGKYYTHSPTGTKAFNFYNGTDKLRVQLLLGGTKIENTVCCLHWC